MTNDGLECAAPDADAREGRRRDKPQQRRTSRVKIDGWINLDKPVGVSSTEAVGRLKFLFNAKKAGHAGTLDPLASGVLPVAFGEATKTVPIVQDGAKAYHFRVRWGEERATDDAEGEVLARSDHRPTPAEIEALLPRFVGAILQTPPTFSAIRIDGARAYDLAREGASFHIEPRLIHVYRLALTSGDSDAAVLEAECGKGTYVRAIARDLGRALGCYGHVIELRRTRVGPFSADEAVPLDRLPDDASFMPSALLPVQAGLAEMPLLPVDRAGAAILRRGQKLLLRGPAPARGSAYAQLFGTPIAFGVIEDGYFAPTRVFNLQG
jgi:tRNA pseudouridine55 synthase